MRLARDLAQTREPDQAPTQHSIRPQDRHNSPGWQDLLRPPVLPLPMTQLRRDRHQLMETGRVHCVRE